MNQSRRLIESLQTINEGTSTTIFFDALQAGALSAVLNMPVSVAERHIITQIVSDDTLADRIMHLPADEDIRPALLVRLEEWLDEGPGPWREPWDEGAQMIIEDLAAVARMVKKMMSKFSINKKVDWNNLNADEENMSFQRALDRVAKAVSKDFQINDKGAKKFISQMVDMRLSVLKA